MGSLSGRRPPQSRLVVVAVVVAALAVLAAACGTEDGASESPEVRPFSEVQDSEFVFEADPADPERAIFRVTTTEPMICAIVWGETEELGNFNNSLAMSGTGIIEHDVVLPGATAGRTYYFRVQGSTADGSLHSSEMSTFTVPESATGAAQGDRSADGTNLALDGSVVDVSSEINDSFAASNAIDGSGSTEWSSSGDGDEASLTIDLGRAEEVAGVEFVTRSMADGSAIAETYTVTVDGEETFGPFPTGTPATPAVADVAVTGRRVRFDVETSTGGNVGAVEIRILGPA